MAELEGFVKRETLVAAGIYAGAIDSDNRRGGG
jgi:hypothetical protein